MQDAKSLRDKLEQRFASLKSDRSSWEGDWAKVQQVIAPNRGRLNTSQRNKGGRRNAKLLIRNAGRFGLRTLAAGMAAGLTSPSHPWFRLTTDDPELAEHAGVREWLDQVEAVAYRAFGVSNFYQSMHAAYSELGGFGQCPVYQQDDFKTLTTFRPLTAGEYWIANGADGKVDTLYQEADMTVIQIVSRFGLANCSQTVRQMHDRGDYQQWVTVRMAIEPKGPATATETRGVRAPFFCAYWEAGGLKDQLLALEPHDEQPFACPRWERCLPDVYGWAPAYDALGDVLELQLASKRITQAIDKMVHPPMQGPPVFQDGINTAPGTYNPVAAEAGRKIEPLYEPGAFRVQEAMMHVASLERDIREAFYVDLFQMFAALEGRQPLTAREIDERSAEKLLMLGPVLTNLDHELLNPVIDRLFNRIVKVSTSMWPDAGIVPPPPGELQGHELKVEYMSSLAQAQRVTRAAPIYRLIETTAQLATFDPRAIVKLDSRQALDEIGQLVGAPAKVLRPDEVVEAMDQAEAQRAEQERAQAMLGGAADAAGKLGRAQLEGTALGSLVGAT